MRKDQNGYIVLETLISFTLYFLFIISILSLVNIVTLQARIHYAMTQAAQTVSMYSYVLYLTGGAEIAANADTGAGKVTGQIADFQTNINGLLDGLGSIDIDSMESSADELITQVDGIANNIADDPKAMIQTFMQYGLDTGGDALFAALIRPLIGRYLANGSMNGDEYLHSVQVIDGLEGLNFFNYDIAGGNGGHTNWINSDGEIELVVQYEVKYSFGGLPLPFDPKLKITQAVKTKLWLGGKGTGYSG